MASDTSQPGDPSREVVMQQAMLHDLGLARATWIKTVDIKTPAAVDAAKLEAQRRANKPGTAEHRKATENKGVMTAWKNFAVDEEGLEATELDPAAGQTHRSLVSASMPALPSISQRKKQPSPQALMRPMGGYRIRKQIVSTDMAQSAAAMAQKQILAALTAKPTTAKTAKASTASSSSVISPKKETSKAKAALLAMTTSMKNMPAPSPNASPTRRKKNTTSPRRSRPAIHAPRPINLAAPGDFLAMADATLLRNPSQTSTPLRANDDLSTQFARPSLDRTTSAPDRPKEQEPQAGSGSSTRLVDVANGMDNSNKTRKSARKSFGNDLIQLSSASEDDEKPPEPSRSSAVVGAELAVVNRLLDDAGLQKYGRSSKTISHILETIRHSILALKAEMHNIEYQQPATKPSATVVTRTSQFEHTGTTKVNLDNVFSNPWQSFVSNSTGYSGELIREFSSTEDGLPQLASEALPSKGPSEGLSVDAHASNKNISTGSADQDQQLHINAEEKIKIAGSDATPEQGKEIVEALSTEMQSMEISSTEATKTVFTFAAGPESGIPGILDQRSTKRGRSIADSELSDTLMADAETEPQAPEDASPSMFSSTDNKDLFKDYRRKRGGLKNLPSFLQTAYLPSVLDAGAAARLQYGGKLTLPNRVETPKIESRPIKIPRSVLAGRGSVLNNAENLPLPVQSALHNLQASKATTGSIMAKPLAPSAFRKASLQTSPTTQTEKGPLPNTPSDLKVQNENQPPSQRTSSDPGWAMRQQLLGLQP